MIGSRPTQHLLAALLLLTTCSLAHATWYSENVQDGADIIMMDLRWPWWPSGTYYANWNSSFNPKPNNITFYAGFVASLSDGPDSHPNPNEQLQSSFRPGSVWTFWGADKDGAPVRFTDVAPNLFIKNNYGGEGSSGTVGSEVWPFVKCKRWYTMLSRVWQPVGNADGKTAYIGRWIKDHADGHWHLIGIARLPIAATSFSGNSGFIESLSGEKVVRPLDRRFGYFRKDGHWLKSDAIAIDKTQYVVVNTVAEDDHEYAAIEYSNRPDLLPQQLSGKPLPGDKKVEFKVKQPDLPGLDKPAVTDVAATSTGQQVAVSWKVPDTASPAFSYRIEVFDNPDCAGAARAIKEQRNPSARLALLDVAAPTPTIRLTITDIFDQTAPPVTVAAQAAPARAAVKQISATIPGLAYELYQKDSTRKINYFEDPLQKPDESHHWLTLEEIGQGKLTRLGLARGFDLGVREQRTAGYALTFKGLLRVPEEGLYILRAQIDGGYRIQLDGKDALTWDGQHGTTEKAAVQNLSKGDHPISVSYIYDQLPTANFGVEWEDPHLPRQPIPLESLRVVDDGAFPVPTVKAEAPGDGTAHITASVDGLGHTINKTALFLDQLQLADSDGPSVKYYGPLPHGKNTLWCRVIFDNNHSVDSNPTALSVTGKPVDPSWTVRNVGDAKSSAGLWQTDTNAFQFFGSGMHTVTKQITGDFTASFRIDEYNGSHGEPVNGRAWVGLAAFEHGDKLNWDWGQFFYAVQTARDGLHASADFTDFGAGRITSYELPKNRPWIRITRQGQIWTAWTSTDGRLWDLGAYQYKKAQPQMDVGLFFSALPQEARAHYHARVSNVSIEPGIVATSTPPKPAVAQHTAGDRLTGVVIARSDPQTVVVRSSSLGLLRTTDGGKTWQPANADLSGDDLCVRSVAIDPENPLVMLRATGRGATGRLWKTTDGGKAWNKLDFPGNFDGSGPSALCGEVIAFDLKNPRIIYAGCESEGFFKSIDAGANWTNLGHSGERITSVVVWPWEHWYPAAAKGRTHLCVTTCADQWMTYLGRGTAAVETKAVTSRGYVSNDNVQTITVDDERSDTGFYNVAFDKAMQSTNEMRYATTHGYQTQVFAGSQMALYPPEKNLEWFRPITAVAATSMGEQKFGRFITAPLDPTVPGRLSRSQTWAFEWSWLEPKGAMSKGGLIAACGDQLLGEKWWFVYTDGLYYSADGGEHMTRILDQSGK